MTNYHKYISEEEEIRDGFKVTSNRKKVWNVQLGLLEEFKKICERHNLKYYADGGTLLGVIRHGGFIPWDDDIDLVMFRDDYEKFLKIAEKELPEYIKLWKHYGGFIKLVNIKTSAFGLYDIRNDEEILDGIWIDIFPIDFASKFHTINEIKFLLQISLRAILVSRKTVGFISNMDMRKQWIHYLLKYISFMFKSRSIYNFHEKIAMSTLFKSKNVYSAGVLKRFFPKAIYNKSNVAKFETTTINIPNGYDVYLSAAYGNYMKPFIREGGHNCRYSVEKSYKEIIKTLDKNKSNEENYNNCKYLFLL